MLSQLGQIKITRFRPLRVGTFSSKNTSAQLGGFGNYLLVTTWQAAQSTNFFNKSKKLPDDTRSRCGCSSRIEPKR